MPIYDYRCKTCGTVQEDKLEHPEVCPECKGTDFARLFPASVGKPRFVGKGFYETDYKGGKREG